jgi:hypothetical protein
VDNHDAPLPEAVQALLAAAGGAWQIERPRDLDVWIAVRTEGRRTRVLASHDPAVLAARVTEAEQAGGWTSGASQ